MAQNLKNKGKYVGMYRSTLDNLYFSKMTPHQFSDLNKPDLGRVEEDTDDYKITSK